MDSEKNGIRKQGFRKIWILKKLDSEKNGFRENGSKKMDSDDRDFKKWISKKCVLGQNRHNQIFEVP